MKHLDIATVVLCFASAANAQTTGVKFFESKIRPVLVKHCYECHSTKSGKARGGLKLDSRDAMQRGGESGPAVVSKSLSKSLLYDSIQYRDDTDYQMPPKGKLPDSVIADFRKWILMGAPDPRVTKIPLLPAKSISIRDVNTGRTSSRPKSIRRSRFDLRGLAPTSIISYCGSLRHTGSRR